jgi:hypothetical protein
VKDYGFVAINLNPDPSGDQIVHLLPRRVQGIATFPKF